MNVLFLGVCFPLRYPKKAFNIICFVSLPCFPGFWLICGDMNVCKPCLKRKKQVVFHKQGKLIFMLQTYCWHYHHNTHHNAHHNAHHGTTIITMTIPWVTITTIGKPTVRWSHRHRIPEVQGSDHSKSGFSIRFALGWGPVGGQKAMAFWAWIFDNSWKKGERQMGSIIFFWGGNQRSSTYMVILMDLPLNMYCLGW